MEKKKPIGVIICSILFLAASIYSFFHPTQETHWFVYPKIFSIIYSSLLLIISIGLFVLLKWSRILAILFALSKILEWVWNIGVILWNTGCIYYWLAIGKLEGLPLQTLKGYISSMLMGITIIILWSIPIYYLTRPKVKEQFK